MKSPTAGKRFSAGLSCALTWVTILSIPLLAHGQEKKYDLKLNWIAVEGHRSQLQEDESQTFKIRISANGQILNQSEESNTKTFVATEVVTKVTAEKPSELRWSFSKAAQIVEGNEKPYAFQGKTVVVTLDAEYRHSYTYENGEALSPEDTAVLAKFRAGSDPNPDDPEGEQIFAPPHPVGVGESWTPDVALMAKSFGSDNVALDVSRSSAKATLLSATTRGNSDFGVIELSLDLYMTKFGPMALDTPVVMHVTGQLDVCIDGTLPDGTMNMNMEIVGESLADLPNGSGKVNIALDMRGKSEGRIQTLM